MLNVDDAMPHRPNISEPAILLMLLDQPRSGYEIRKYAQRHLSHFWQVSFGQIYPTLNKMSRRRLVTSLTFANPGNKPDRRVYSLTPLGEKRIREWLERPLPPTFIVELLLKLAFVRHHSGDSILHELRTFKAAHVRSLDLLNELQQAMNVIDAEGRALTVAHQRAIARARIAWCNEAIEQMKGQAVSS